MFKERKKRSLSFGILEQLITLLHQKREKHLKYNRQQRQRQDSDYEQQTEHRLKYLVKGRSTESQMKVMHSK